MNARGYIEVNERLATSAPNIWAMGECAGTPQFTHAAYDDFRIVSGNPKGDNRTTKDRLITDCMFTDPELVRIGLNKSEARRRGIPFRLAKLPVATVARAKTISEPRGFMEMPIGKDSGEILGFTALGAEASELLAAVQTAMIGRLPYASLTDRIFAHPTMAEGFVLVLASELSAGLP